MHEFEAPFALAHRLDRIGPDARRFAEAEADVDAEPLVGQAQVARTFEVELRAEFAPGDASEVVFTVRGAKIIYDARKQEISVAGQTAPAPLRNGRQRLVVYCDRTGLEVFASDGFAYIPMPYQPKPADLALSLEAKGGAAKITSLEVHELKPAWKTAAR